MGSLGDAVVVRRPQTSDIMQSGSTLSLALRGHKLDNKDFFSKSDPYIVISKPVNGGWTPIRTSETIKDDLNPVWKAFLLFQHELPDESEKLKFEVFDDDGKFGKDTSDESIGFGFFNLKELENAFKNQTLLPIQTRRLGRKSGSLMLTQFQPRDHSPGGQGSGYPRPGYPPVKTSSGGPGVSSNLYSSTTHSAGGFVMPGRN